MRMSMARSVLDIQANLEQAYQCDRESHAQGRSIISERYRANLIASLEQLRAADTDHREINKDFTQILNQRREHMEELKRQVRDFYQVLKRRSIRLGYGRALELLYGRPDRIPHSTTMPVWLAWGGAIIKGEAAAQAKGYPRMVNPSAQDIERALAKATASQQQWSQTQQILKEREQRLRQAGAQGIRTLRGLAARLREALATTPPATRRDLMRAYGFNFAATGARDRPHPTPLPTQLEPARTPPPEPESLPSVSSEPTQLPAPEPTIEVGRDPVPHTREKPTRKLSRRQKKALKRQKRGQAKEKPERAQRIKSESS